jgi:flagellar operon protein
MDARLTPAGRVAPTHALVETAAGSTASRPAPGPAFRTVLQESVGFRFSAHATERLETRGLRLDAGQLGRLEAGIDRAAAKGSRDALVLLDDMAMVVAVPNRTVVTAMPRADGGGSVFTNIDAAVLI